MFTTVPSSFIRVAVLHMLSSKRPGMRHAASFPCPPNAPVTRCPRKKGRETHIVIRSAAQAAWLALDTLPAVFLHRHRHVGRELEARRVRCKTCNCMLLWGQPASPLVCSMRSPKGHASARSSKQPHNWYRRNSGPSCLPEWQLYNSQCLRGLHTKGQGSEKYW